MEKKNDKEIFFIAEDEVVEILKEKLGRELTKDELVKARKYFGRKSGFSQVAIEEVVSFADMFVDELLEDRYRGFVIDESYIDSEIENYYKEHRLERSMLTNDEKEEVYYIFESKLLFTAQDSIREVIDDLELSEKNKGAELELPHFTVRWRNKNSYQNDWKRIGVFKTQEDAEKYTRTKRSSVHDEYSLSKVISYQEEEFIGTRERACNQEGTF